MKFASAVFRRPWLYRLAGRMARTIVPWLPRFMLYNPLNVWGRRRELPEFPKESFQQAYARRQKSSRKGA